MHLLLIEDDPFFASAIAMPLRDERIVVDITDSGEEAVELAKRGDFDAIILDLNLPDMSGLEVIRRIRAAKISTPVLVVSGEREAQMKVRALTAGGDDYVTKPFNTHELLARVRALVRRSKGLAHSIIEIGAYTIDINSKTVEAFGRRIRLSVKEYQILELLCMRTGTTLTKEVFLNHLYSGMDDPDPKIIDVFVCKLRKKLAAVAGAEPLIETVWGRGYLVRHTDTPPIPQAA